MKEQYIPIIMPRRIETLYTCLRDVAIYVPKRMQIKITSDLIDYWRGDDGFPILFIGGDWAGTNELGQLLNVLRKKRLKEGKDFFVFPINMTRYLGDVEEDDMERFIRYEGSEIISKEGGEYRIISTPPGKLRKLIDKPNRRFAKTLFVDDWGNSYTSALGYYKWLSDAIQSGILDTKNAATLFIKDFRRASQYAIVRQEPEDGIVYGDIIEMMKYKAPKLLNYLKEKDFTKVIEKKPEIDLAVNLEELISRDEANREVLDPSTTEMLNFIREMANAR